MAGSSSGKSGGKKGSGKKRSGGGSTPGPLTGRFQSIAPDARDNVPRTDNSAAGLLFVLTLMLAALLVVVWNMARPLLSPGPSAPPERVPGLPASTDPLPVSSLTLQRPAMLTIYGADPSGRYLIPFQERVEAEADPLELLRRRLDGPAPGKGTERILPAGETLRDLRREGSLAIVDLHPSTLDALPGEASRHALLEALTRQVTAIPGIDRVRFLIEGRAVDFTDDGLDLAEPWVVENPLNALDSAVSGRLASFYFLDKSGGYLVPVQLDFTPPAHEPNIAMRAALERLMEGPPPGQDLQPVIAPQLALESLDYVARDQELKLAFSSSDPPQAWGLYKPSLLVPAIVQTLEEIAPIAKLQCTINEQDIWTVESFSAVQRKVAAVDAYNPVQELR